MFFQRKACANTSLFSNSKANNNKLRWPRNIKRSPKQSLGDFFLFFPLTTIETISGVTKERINLLNLELNRKWKGMLKFLSNVQFFKRVIFEGQNKKSNLASVFFFLAQCLLFDKCIFWMQGCFKLFDLTGAKNDLCPMHGLSPWTERNLSKDKASFRIQWHHAKKQSEISLGKIAWTVWVYLSFRSISYGRHRLRTAILNIFSQKLSWQRVRPKFLQKNKIHTIKES